MPVLSRSWQVRTLQHARRVHDLVSHTIPFYKEKLESLNLSFEPDLREG